MKPDVSLHFFVYPFCFFYGNLGAKNTIAASIYKSYTKDSA